MRTYPTLNNSAEPKKIIDAVNQIARIRGEDITDWNNLPQVFISGRKVGKIPTGSTDTAATDRAGDLNYDSAHAFIAVNIGSTLAWGRWAVSSTW